MKDNDKESRSRKELNSIIRLLINKFWWMKKG